MRSFSAILLFRAYAPRCRAVCKVKRALLLLLRASPLPLTIHLSCCRLLSAPPPPRARRYISYAKQNVQPRLSDESIVELQEGWLAMRRLGSVGAKKIVTATARQLESLIRCALVISPLFARSFSPSRFPLFPVSDFPPVSVRARTLSRRIPRPPRAVLLVSLPLPQDIRGTRAPQVR